MSRKFVKGMAIGVLCVLFLLRSYIAWTLRRENPPKENDIEISVGVLQEALSDGKIIDMGDVFSFEWDKMTIVNAIDYIENEDGKVIFPAQPIIEHYNGEYNFAHDIKFYIMFFNENELVGFIDYRPDGGRKPQFWDNGKMRYNWMLELEREDAVFSCTKIDDGWWSNYRLELIKET